MVGLAGHAPGGGYGHEDGVALLAILLDLGEHILVIGRTINRREYYG